MSGRIRNVTPKAGFVFDGRDVIPAPSNVMPIRSTFTVDGALANIMSGRGTSVDRSSYDTWTFLRKNPQQIEAAYRGNWLCRKIVDIPCQDMTRAGRDWDAADDQIAAIEREEKRLGLWSKVMQAMVLGRLGGGAILIGARDRRPDLPLPANVDTGFVEWLAVLSRYQLTVGEMETDPASPMFGEPRYFRLGGSGKQVDVHPSRVIAFKGMPAPGLYMTTWEDQYWGDSVIQTVDDAIKQAVTATQGFANLIDEAKVDVFTMPGMYETLAKPGGEAKFMQALQTTAQGKSMWRMLALGEGETWETRQINWAGMPDVIKTYLSIVAGAADIPATRLLGKSADGMNATGQGDERNYLAMIAAKQTMELRPIMDRLDAVVLPSAGVTAELPWKFSPISTLSETEEAEIELKEAQALEKIVGLALVPETAMAKTVQNRLIESGRWPGLKKAIDEAEKAGEELPDKVDESELGIVPLGEKGGGQGSAGSGGNADPNPARRAVNDAATWLSDATPRPLYVQRKLLNAADLIAWAKDNGFATTLPASDMHVTVLYSRSPVDPMKMGRDWREDEKGQIIVRPGGPRVIEKLGENAVVLRFACPDLDWRHKDMIEAGGSHDWPEYQPHVTISYAAPEGVDIDALKPFNGALRFGPEIFEALDLDWKSKIAEA